MTSLNYSIASLSSFKLSRIKCSEFIIELDGIISRREYSKVFTNPHYKELRELWKLELNKKSESTPADEEYHVKQFRIFLFQYNQ